MKNLNIRLISIIGLILLVSLSRLIPHLPNFTPVTALALFAGSYIRDKKFAFTVPLLAMFISDIFIGFHPLIWAVYLSLLIGVLLGKLLETRKNIFKIFGVTLVSSIVFFIITNFAHWLMYYDPSWQTLTKCYFDAIPFYRNSLLGDFIFVSVMFGSFALAEKYVPVLTTERIK